MDLLPAFEFRQLDDTGIDGDAVLAVCDARRHSRDFRLACRSCRWVSAGVADLGRRLQRFESCVNVCGDALAKGGLYSCNTT
jgi:hypothetical protein